MATKNSKATEPTGLYTAGLVLGIIGVVFAFIPFFYGIAYILGILALIFGIIGLVKKVPGHKALAATILGAVALVVGIVMNIITVNTVNEWTDELTTSLSDFLDDYSDDVIGKTLDVTLLGYQEIDDGIADHGLVVSLKNISDKTRSYSVYIEALDEDGNRIDESYVSAENLAPGQSYKTNAFTWSSISDEVLEKATFKVYKASSY